MKYIKMVSTTLMITGALTALTTTAATAHSWLNHGNPLASSKAVKGASELTFENLKVGSRFVCAIQEQGTVGTLGMGEITSITSTTGSKAIPCTIIGGGECETAMEIEALKLPWKTELATVSGELRNTIKGGPEWQTKCKGHGETWTNDCLASTNAGIKNVASGVDETYDSNSPHGSCFLPSGPFVTTGTELLKLVEAGTLLSAT